MSHVGRICGYAKCAGLDYETQVVEAAFEGDAFLQLLGYESSRQ